MSLKDIKDKAEDLAKKAKDGVDVEAIKKNAEDVKNGMTAEKIQGLDTKKKAIIGGVALVLAFLIFGGGGAPAGSLDKISEPFPTEGSIEEQCNVVVMQEYNFWKLMNDKNESAEDITAAYASAAQTFNQAKVPDMNELEKRYWKFLRPAKNLVKKQYPRTKFKEKLVNYDRYMDGIDKCIELYDN